ncbi:ATP-binding protein [Marinobacter sp.]|uniref:ATP-binding protein n=1 Tax=Marinobacter sp. TaxID=50741 RepID=UPI002B4AA270|nr:ATP-binding protein [Marinobacter sp.]HKK56813.1 ATP-binding protein [Marinobacter sp.]
MTVAAREQRLPADHLQPEWDRLQHLGYCLSRSRQGLELESGTLKQLEQLQAQVEQLRQPGGHWECALNLRLAPIEWDVLACVLGPELEPRLGWMFQNLQSGSAQPYPCRALIQELLALEPHQAQALQRALEQSAPLRARGLLRAQNDDPYQPLTPEPWLGPKLRGEQRPLPSPPGATRVTPLARWDDLVLPANRLAQLREFMLWLEHRKTVIDQWGGQPVGGPVALFNGPSGTGKTLAASAIASRLGWELYRVDIGRLVSKYIGETEKNLNQLFYAVHDRPMVLQFDEADALFAKRGEVKEARDRYANMEVSHLLARIESHRGPCILTTNLRKQIDSAFTRRFQMVVEFPRPGIEGRARLWDKLLPPRAPRGPGVDTRLLARSVNLTGGGIRNAALHAAYLAAGDSEQIELRHLALGAWRELAKEGRDQNPRELGELAAHLPREIIDD